MSNSDDNGVTADDEPGRSQATQTKRLLWKFAVACALVALLIVIPLVCYREWRLSRVPEIGDPFPVSGVVTSIAPDDNAYPLFEEAFALLVDVPDADIAENAKQQVDGWDSTDRLLNKYLSLNQPALEKWREATEKTRHVIVPASEALDWDVQIRLVLSHRTMLRYCTLQIEKLTESDRPADAFRWLRASFRCSSLMTRNAPVISRLVGAAFWAISTQSAEKWMQHPDVTAEQLQRLLSVVDESARLMMPLSTASKVNYLIARRDYAEWSYDEMKAAYDRYDSDPPLGSRWETWLRAEPEFSRRLTAHMTANHLAYIDKPRRDRPPLLGGDVFDETAVGAKATGRLPAEELFDLLQESKLLDAPKSEFVSDLLDQMDWEQARIGCLRVAIAAQRYYRNHGMFPRRLTDLQPDYLPSIPDDLYAPKPSPLIYRRTEDGAVVYSRYSNGIDDGGSTVTIQEAIGQYPPDFGIRIRTPSYPPVVAPRP